MLTLLQDHYRRTKTDCNTRHYLAWGAGEMGLVLLWAPFIKEGACLLASEMGLVVVATVALGWLSSVACLASLSLAGGAESTQPKSKRM